MTTSSASSPSDAPRFRSHGAYLRERFGGPVRRVSVDAGFTCPNRDGNVGRGGCIFCANEAFSPAAGQRSEPVRAQLEGRIRNVLSRKPDTRFLAYFQPYSNTYALVDRRESLYRQALDVKGVVGVCIGTRPDCVDEGVAELLTRLSAQTYVQLELGLQSANDGTLAWMGRGHDTEAFRRAMQRCRGRGFDLCGHMITGLPGESPRDMLRSAEVMVSEGVTGVKIHNLHVVRGSRLAAEYERKPFPLLGLDEHVRIVCDILERLPRDVTVQRLAGTADRAHLIAPEWCADGSRVRASVDGELRRRGTRQGERA